MRKLLIVKVETLEGRDWSLDVYGRHGDRAAAMFLLVDAETGEVDDYGYRSFEEAASAAPHAVNAGKVQL
jgi:hypothetical protein